MRFHVGNDVTEICAGCGGRLNLATYFDKEKPSLPARHMLWCSNEHCGQFGVMVARFPKEDSSPNE
jgi:hypothetical protein